MHNEMVDAIVGCRSNVIVTMRAKTEYVLEEDSRGKKVPRKIGMAPIQRDGLEYEFTVVGDLTIKGVTNLDPLDLARSATVTASAESGAARAALIADIRGQGLRYLTGATISPFSIRNRPSRVMPVLSNVMLSTGRMYQKKVTSNPRFVDLIICSIVASPPSITRLWFGLVGVNGLSCFLAQ